MTTATLEPGRSARARRAAWIALNGTLHVVLPQLRTRARATRRHLQDHAYTIAGLSLVSAAAFVHSVFTGLLVTGLLFLVFEWKVSDE